MKTIYFLSFFISIFSYSQQIKVVDSETEKPISNARIIGNNQVLYTNEDGLALFSSVPTFAEISFVGYQKQNLTSYLPVVKLQPIYREIQEVKMKTIDIKDLLEDVLKNYSKRYYDEPSSYDVVLKQKSFDNNKLDFLVISEAKILAKTNMYNYKYGFRKDYDKIMQIQLNKVKYIKSVKSDSIFKGSSNEFSHETVGNYFFNFELNRITTIMKQKNAKFSGMVVAEEGDEQIINFKVNATTILEGEIKFNKKDKVITYFKALYGQENYPVLNRKTTDGREYKYKLGEATITFEFYKNNGVYVPSLNSFVGDNFFIFYKDETHSKKFSREIIYNTFEKAGDKNLEPRVSLSKSIWQNVAVKDDKASTVLLSKEEQDFVNQK